MNDQDRKELEDILSVAAPVLGQLMNKAVLEALRQHADETGASKLVAEALCQREEVIRTTQIGERMNFSPTTKPSSEVPGEREVWAQAYAAMLRNYDPIHTNPKPILDRAAKHADEAVKAFRERYK